MYYSKLIDVAELYDSLHSTPQYSNSGFPMVRVADVSTGNLQLDNCLRVNNSDYIKYTTKHVPVYGDIVISRVGTYGVFAFVNTNSKFCLGQNTAILSPRINQQYLFYCLNSPLIKRQIDALVVGSTQKTISLKNIKSLVIPRFGELNERKISSILSALDSKIENINQINENLAEQIQTIYSKEFDPNTHKPSGVLADICQYSSDRIPVSELSESTYFSTENMQSNKMGSTDATSLPSITLTTGCNKGDVLISNIRPYFKKIVYVTDDNCGCSTDVLCFVPKEKQFSAFLFGTLYMDRFFDYMVAGSKGTKMPRGDKQQIMNYPIVLPEKKSLDIFNGLIVPMLDQIATNRIEISRLATLRDALLPKLMSGELDVSALDF